MKKFLPMIMLTFIFTPPTTAQAYEQPIAGISISLQACSSNTAVKPISPIEIYILEYSELYGVDSNLIKAIMGKESNGDTQAYNTNKNGTYDSGLMQINSCNYEWLREELGITDFYNARQNIHCGVYIISLLTARYSNLHKVLMSYNMGEGRMRELWNEGITSSRYSRGVMEKFEKLKEEEK